MGSVMFLAPEVRRGEKATPAADAYALGVTFYRLLTGIWYEPGTVADGLLAEFGREWRTALRRLLADEPAARLPLPTIELAQHSAKRRWCIAFAFAAAVVAVLVFLWMKSHIVESPMSNAESPMSNVQTPSTFDIRPTDIRHSTFDLGPSDLSFDHFFPLHEESSRQ